jgi:hypothetical protein
MMEGSGVLTDTGCMDTTTHTPRKATTKQTTTKATKAPARKPGKATTKAPSQATRQGGDCGADHRVRQRRRPRPQVRDQQTAPAAGRPPTRARSKAPVLEPTKANLAKLLKERQTVEGPRPQGGAHEEDRRDAGGARLVMNFPPSYGAIASASRRSSNTSASRQSRRKRPNPTPPSSRQPHPIREDPPDPESGLSAAAPPTRAY